MSNVKVEIGDDVMLKGNAFLLMSEERYMSLVRRTHNRQQNVLFSIVNIVDDIVTVELFSKSKNIKYFEVPMKCLRYVPKIGQFITTDYFSDKCIVREVDLLNKSVIVECLEKDREFTKSIRLAKINKFSEPEVKETPFQDIVVVLEADFLCNVTKIGWNSEEGNILSVSSLYSGGVFFGGSITEKEFMKQNITILSKEGEELCRALENTSSLDKVVNTKLGVYDCFYTPGLSIVFKQFKNHGKKDIIESCSSLRNFCERFSEHMIKQ